MIASPPKRREFGRRQSHLKAMAHIPGRGSYPCIVRNVSLGGAFVEFDQHFHVPAQFELEIAGLNEVFLCSKRHMAGAGVGVMFMSGDIRPLLISLGAMDSGDMEPIYYVERPVETKGETAHAAALKLRARLKAAV